MKSMILGNYAESGYVIGDDMKTEVMFYLKANLSRIWYKFIGGSTIHLTLTYTVCMLETRFPLANYPGVF